MSIALHQAPVPLPVYAIQAITAQVKLKLPTAIQPLRPLWAVIFVQLVVIAQLVARSLYLVNQALFQLKKSSRTTQPVVLVLQDLTVKEVLPILPLGYVTLVIIALEDQILQLKTLVQLVVNAQKDPVDLPNVQQASTNHLKEPRNALSAYQGITVLEAVTQKELFVL